MATLIEKLNYEPSQLKFGTSGLRGLLSDMTDLECYINAAGFLSYLKENSESALEKVYIAGDLRSSTPRISRAIAQAISDFELEVVNCGQIPTPALVYFAMENDSPSIMITGSHIPDDRNGVKFNKSSGEVLKSDEPKIQDHVETIRREIYQETTDRFGEDGSLESSIDLPVCDPLARKEYIARYTNYFPADCLKDTQIVFYQHSAVGRDLIPEILTQLGADVKTTARSEKFVPIDTENVRPSDELLFKEFVKEYPDCFAVVSTDGDSDRPFVVDEKGDFHMGDLLGIVVAEYLGSKAIAVPINSNDAVQAWASASGVTLKYTKIGSPHVIVAMDQLKDDYTNVSGWEMNGGFLTGEDYETDSGQMLRALQTRDALLPIICSILDAKAKGLQLSELFTALPERYVVAGLIDNFPDKVSRQIIKELSTGDESIIHSLESVFTPELGFKGGIKNINCLDGARITFGNGDVAHIRPSSNAPQLRIYANADTKDRAAKIVEQAIAEPHGALREIEKIVTGGQDS